MTGHPSPAAGARGWTRGLSIQADSPYEVFVPPPPPPEPVLGEQTPLTTEEARELFERMGWEWPW